MSLPIISADQRLAEERGVKAAIFGPPGIGKTTLLRTLNSTTSLFFDLEAGDLAIEGLAIDTIRPRTWRECRDFAVFIGGPNPALRKDQPYSEDHYQAICQKCGDPKVLEKYDTVFIDSITVAGRLCFQWCKGQPEAHSDKTGKPDVRGAYGLHGREMIAWLTHLQHTRAKIVIFVGILDEKVDDFNRKVFVPQIDGSKTGLELPGIVDQPRLPRFKAYTNYDNYVGVGSWTKIAINNTDYNDQGAFDNATNRFVAPVDGTYLFGATLLYKVNSSTTARMRGRLVLNGATEIRGSLGEISATHVSLATAIWLQTMVPLTAGDTVELQGYFRVADGYFAADHTSFWGAKIG